MFVPQCCVRKGQGRGTHRSTHEPLQGDHLEVRLIPRAVPGEVNHTRAPVMTHLECSNNVNAILTIVLKHKQYG